MKLLSSDVMHPLDLYSVDGARTHACRVRTHANTHRPNTHNTRAID